MVSNWIFKILRFPLLAVTLSSCAIGPNYEAPELDVPEEYSSKLADQGDVLDKQILWWRYFQDETLNNLIEQSVTSNLSVRQALTRINQSRALAREAFSELLPGALLNASYTKAEDTNSRFPGSSGGTFEYEVYTGSVDALWEIDIFGRLRRELEARNAEHAEQVANLHDAVRMVIAEVAMSYFELRAAQVQLQISERNRELQSQSLELVRSKFELGQVSELDLARSQTQLAQTEAGIPSVQASVSAQINRLSVLVGKHPKFLEPLLKSSTDIPKFSGSPTIGSPADLLRKRPDVKSAEQRLVANNARIGVALGELFPKISISGAIGFEASQLSDWGANTRRYSFGPSISWAAFDTGRLRARVDEADEKTKEALLYYEETVLKALEDVENALSDYSAEQRRLVKLNAAVAASNRAYTIANEQYKEGILDFVSVLDTQRTLLQSESDAVASEKNVSLALVGIYKALGGGWEAWDLASKSK